MSSQIPAATARLDLELVRRGLITSRTQAQRAIQASQVQVNGKAVDRPGLIVGSADDLQLTGTAYPYVGRGGFKLQAALDHFAVEVQGARCLDVGASTGGFTDCLLRRGAAHVVAIDVGHSQMHEKLLTNSSVELREGINARNLQPRDFHWLFDLIVVDLSFISLRLVLPALVPLLVPNGSLICLIKPQFEVGRSGVQSGGIVRDQKLRASAVASVQETACSLGLRAAGLIESPIAGGDGNLEFLALYQSLSLGVL